MKTYIKLLTVTFFSLLISCQSDIKEVKEYDEAGVLSRSYMLDRDSLIQGVLKSYYEDGVSIFEEAQYVDGSVDGMRKLYFEDGQVEIEEKYIAGVLVDTLRVYYQSGQLRRYETYNKEGTLSGVVQSYYENGKVKETVTYADNIENGPFIEYHSNGNIKWKGTFLNGDNEYGELLQYDSTGTLIRKLECDSIAVCRTFWTIQSDQSS